MIGCERWRDIDIKRGPGGAGRVISEEKCVLIPWAESVWKRMGLSQEQVAFGIATMNVESGFNPKAKNPAPHSTAYGLGQFTSLTWTDAVNYYNDTRNHFRGRNEPKIEKVSGREDVGVQIKVMGVWINRV